MRKLPFKPFTISSLCFASNSNLRIDQINQKGLCVLVDNDTGETLAHSRNRAALFRAAMYEAG